ncbi:trimeric intracellular cation channel family protein [Corynebacterium otitidis]
MNDASPTVGAIYDALDLLGVLLNGILGGTIARKRGFDIMGFLVLALFSALGGGMIRDMLLDKGTAAAFADPWYLVLAFTGALVALVTNFKGRTWDIVKSHLDAVVLGAWAVTGASKALAFGLPPVSCAALGVVTAVGGGMVRDVVSGQIPSIFGGSPLYAIPAVLSSVSMVIFSSAGLTQTGMIVAPLLGMGLAILAFWKGWVMPVTTEWAPVNYSAAHMGSFARRAVGAGRRRVNRGRDALRHRRTKNPFLPGRGNSVEEIRGRLVRHLHRLWRQRDED